MANVALSRLEQCEENQGVGNRGRRGETKREMRIMRDDDEFVCVVDLE